MNCEILCEILEWDSEFFGYRIARVLESLLTPERASAIDDWSREHGVECLYFLADFHDRETVRAAEGAGFAFVDARLTLERKSLGKDSTADPRIPDGVLIRPARPEDIADLAPIAGAIHSDTRFFWDLHFARERCEALYRLWFKKSCEGLAERVFVAEIDKRPMGYVTCQLGATESVGSIGLLGLSPEAQGRGIAPALVGTAVHWFDDRGVESVSVVTQARNMGAQRVYQRCGFLSREMQLWYHKWFVEPSNIRSMD